MTMVWRTTAAPPWAIAECSQRTWTGEPPLKLTVTMAEQLGDNASIMSGMMPPCRITCLQQVARATRRGAMGPAQGGRRQRWRQWQPHGDRHAKHHRSPAQHSQPTLRAAVQQ